MKHFKSYSRIQFLFFALLVSLSVLQAQVPVHKEPRHRPVFENNEIRILNVLLPPNDTTQYHIHTTPSLFIFFTNTTTGSQLQGREETIGTSNAGHLLFENLAAPNIRIHRVWNVDKDTFHVMDVELLYKDGRFTQKPLTIPNLKLAIDTPWVRAYRLTLVKGNEFKLENEKQSFVLVSLDASNVQILKEGKNQNQTLKQGHFFDVKRKLPFYIKNIGNVAAEFALLELPVQ